MRRDLNMAYQFGLPVQLYYAQELTSIALAYFIARAYRRQMISYLPTIGDLNEISVEFKCPYFTTVSEDLSDLIANFDEVPGKAELEEFLLQTKLPAGCLLQDSMIPFVHMFATKLFATMVYADRIAQFMPGLTRQQLCDRLSIRERYDNPFVEMVIMLDDMHRNKEPFDMIKVIYLSYLTISPRGHLVLPKEQIDLFALAFWDMKSAEIIKSQLVATSSMDWIVL